MHASNFNTETMNLTCYVCDECVCLTYFHSASYAPFLCLYCWQFFSLWAFVIFPLSMYMYHLWVVDLFSIFELCLISIHVLSLCNWPLFRLWAIRCPRMQQCLSHASFPGTVPFRCSRFQPTWQTAIPLYSWMLKGRILSHFWI